ncbi:LysR substrate-binding domain-containing protein [Paenibacillus nasutitermitis]|uniref:LysR substrate-binding domain-containing protein n=1 Tax=Paenibacillus nasutitermitis TaxID=1652958 RepID=UPI00166B0632|nr:LysR substrate-binding domain-containing protein [Paenibacillus nasutitermitis]
MTPEITLPLSKIANTDEIAQAVHANELGIGLVEGNVECRDILVTPPFMEDEMVLVAPRNHPLSLQRIIEPGELQDQVWVFRENGFVTRAFSDQFIGELGLCIKRSFGSTFHRGIVKLFILHEKHIQSPPPAGYHTSEWRFFHLRE